MRFHYNTEPSETVAYLRDAAIQAKSPPAVIDALDVLAERLEDAPALEERDEELNKMEQARDDLREELSDLVEKMELACDILNSIDKARAGAGPATFYDQGDLNAANQALAFAKKALERHKDS